MGRHPGTTTSGPYPRLHPVIEQLRYERITKRIPMRELEAVSGYSDTAISYMERGSRSSSFHMIAVIAELLGYEIQLCPASSKPTTPTSTPSTTSPAPKSTTASTSASPKTSSTR